MIPNITRGGSARRALDYDASRGRANEHVAAHVVTGSESVRTACAWQRPALSRPELRRRIAREIEAPRVEWGREVHQHGKPAHIWRCSLTLAPGEKLTENQWAKVGREFVQRMGYADCEWVLTRHGGSGRESLDHAHLTVNLVQVSDGKRAPLSHDRHRAQTAAARIARELGLTELAGQQRHLPKSEQRKLDLRALTQGVRQELWARINAAGPRQTVEALAAQRVLARRVEHGPRAGWAYALTERPDIWVTASDLHSRYFATRRAGDAPQDESRQSLADVQRRYDEAQQRADAAQAVYGDAFRAAETAKQALHDAETALHEQQGRLSRAQRLADAGRRLIEAQHAYNDATAARDALGGLSAALQRRRRGQLDAEVEKARWRWDGDAGDLIRELRLPAPHTAQRLYDSAQQQLDQAQVEADQLTAAQQRYDTAKATAAETEAARQQTEDAYRTIDYEAFQLRQEVINMTPARRATTTSDPRPQWERDLDAQRGFTPPPPGLQHQPPHNHGRGR